MLREKINNINKKCIIIGVVIGILLYITLLYIPRTQMVVSLGMLGTYYFDVKSNGIIYIKEPNETIVSKPEEWKQNKYFTFFREKRIKLSLLERIKLKNMVRNLCFTKPNGEHYLEFYSFAIRVYIGNKEYTSRVFDMDDESEWSNYKYQEEKYNRACTKLSDYLMHLGKDTGFFIGVF